MKIMSKSPNRHPVRVREGKKNYIFVNFSTFQCTDFGTIFGLKCKAHKTFDIIVSPNFFFKFRFGGPAAQHPLPPSPLGATMISPRACGCNYTPLEMSQNKNQKIL
jgi:hypothetical protein